MKHFIHLNDFSKLEIIHIFELADMVIVRHKDLPLIEYMAEHSNIPIINAMTAVNHPCEILTDLYSLSKKYVDYS